MLFSNIFLYKGKSKQIICLIGRSSYNECYRCRLKNVEYLYLLLILRDMLPITNGNFTMHSIQRNSLITE